MSLELLYRRMCMLYYHPQKQQDPAKKKVRVQILVDPVHSKQNCASSFSSLQVSFKQFVYKTMHVYQCG